MVALASFLIALMQTVAQASTDVPSATIVTPKCSADVESTDNVLKVCLLNEDGNSALVISRYLGSGEVETERIPLAQGELTKFLAGEGLGSSKIFKAKTFVRAPSATTK